MYRWIKPQIAIPVHGEARHLHEHLALARRLEVPRADRGAQRRPGAPRAGSGRRCSTRCRPAGWCPRTATCSRPSDDLYRTRRRLMAHGTILVGLVLDRYGSLLAAPQLSTFGAVDLEREPGLKDGVVDEIEDAIEALEDELRSTTSGCARRCAAPTRRALRLARDKRPIIEVQITRLAREALDSLDGRRRAGAMIGRLNHVAIAVPGPARPRRRSIASCSAPRSRAPVPQPAHGVTTVFVELPNTKIELLQPLGDDSPIAAFLAAPSGRRHPPSVLRGRRTSLAARDRLVRRGRARAGRRRAQARRPRQAGPVPPSQGFLRHPGRARAGLTARCFGAGAVFVIVWWLVLFMVLPFGAGRPTRSSRAPSRAPRQGRAWPSRWRSPR